MVDSAASAGGAYANTGTSASNTSCAQRRCMPLMAMLPGAMDRSSDAANTHSPACAQSSATSTTSSATPCAMPDPLSCAKSAGLTYTRFVSAYLFDGTLSTRSWLTTDAMVG